VNFLPFHSLHFLLVFYVDPILLLMASVPFKSKTRFLPLHNRPWTAWSQIIAQKIHRIVLRFVLGLISHCRSRSPSLALLSQACQRSKDYCSVNTMILWRLLVTSVAKWRWKMRAERTSDTNDTTNSSLNDDWWTTPVGKPGSTLSRLKMFPCEQFQFSARHTARLCNGILWKPAIS